jgi:hypothetical protein
MKNSIFWVITPYSVLNINGLSRGMCNLHLQDRRISHSRNQHKADSKIACLAYSSTLKMEATYSSETALAFNGLHSVISQKIEVFEVTVVFLRFSKRLPGWQLLKPSPSALSSCRAIAQAVSRRLPTAAARVQTRVWSCGIL